MNVSRNGCDRFPLAILVTALLVLVPATSAEDIEGLDGPTSAVFDATDVPTVIATTEHDAIFMQGYLHARNRLFQMDFQRRQFSGTLAELLGPAAIPTDVQLRTLGLKRSAEVSLPVQPPEMQAWLQAYADGVNALLADTSIPLPPEYAALELNRDAIPLWTPLDSVITAKGLAFGLSFDLSDIDRTLAFLNFNGFGPVFGFSGIGLFFTDLYRSAPFDPTISIPFPNRTDDGTSVQYPTEPADFLTDTTRSLLQNYRDSIADIPILASKLEPGNLDAGSNWFMAAPAITESGQAIFANDPHLALDTPATFYEIHLVVEGGLNVAGVSFPGAPGIVQGCNLTMCWGSTVNPMDVTDVYQEVLLALDTPGLPPGTLSHSFFRGVPEPLLLIPQQFFANGIGDGVENTIGPVPVPADQGGVTLVVPRHNFAPILQIDASDPAMITAFSVAFVGAAPTTELEAFRQIAFATTPDEFRDALQFFDHGSQNFAYADINGNIAYYTSGELPIREDLQIIQGPDGFQPPFLIRDGTGTLLHEWLPVSNPQPQQSLGFEILPFNEMPQVVNPSNNYILNANNDPIGTTIDNISFNQGRPGGGVFYLSPGYATGLRQGRIQRLVDEILAVDGQISIDDFEDIQNNNQLLDAEVFTPFLLDAFANASDPGAPAELAPLGADPAIAEAISRLAGWDFGTPTGIPEGYDPGDNPAALPAPTQDEIDSSVAATIYALWRGQVIQRVIDGTLNAFPVPLGEFAPGSTQSMTALRNLLDQFPSRNGVGISGINFFNVPGASSPEVARDIILLQALRNALDLAASDDFAPAFGNSTNQEDYRWGKLHRITFDSVLGSIFSIPPNPFTGLTDLAPDLPGISRAGGLGAVDASAHSARADGLNEFMFGSGPNRRALATLGPECPDFREVIPGGQSGVLGSPFQADQLRLWLVNANKPLPLKPEDSIALAVREETYRGSPPVIECGAPVLAADKDCIAAAACSTIATCTDPDGREVIVECGSEGPFGQGTSDVTVTCTDGKDTTEVTCPVVVEDQTPPSGGIASPPQNACFGLDELPVSIVGNFDDNCDPNPGVTQEPAGDFTVHGDYAVSVIGTDADGNATPLTSSFTIDVIPPVVELQNLGDIVLPSPDVPLSMFISSTDEDAASGGVVLERIVLSSTGNPDCVLVDGTTFGDGDGLIVDENVTITVEDLQLVVAQCHIKRVKDPVLTFESTDCGGNVGIAARDFKGRQFDTLRVNLNGADIDVAWGAEGMDYTVCSGATPQEAAACSNVETSTSGNSWTDAGAAGQPGLRYYFVQVDE